MRSLDLSMPSEGFRAEILAAHFQDKSLPLSAFTEEQLTRLKESIEQAKRGEVIPAEEIDIFLEDWFKELAAPLSRFFLSPYAKRDLAEIKGYMEFLPDVPADKIAPALQRDYSEDCPIIPTKGSDRANSRGLRGSKVRSGLALSHRIVYTLGGNAPEIVGVLHTARDIASIMAKRLQ